MTERDARLIGDLHRASAMVTLRSIVPRCATACAALEELSTVTNPSVEVNAECC